MQVTRQPSIQSTSSESSTAASVSSNAPVFASPLPPRVTTRKALDPTTVPPPVSRPPIHTDDVVHKPPTINIGRENIGNFGLGMTGANDRPTRARTATSKAEDVSHAVTGIVVGAGMAAKSLFHEAKNFFEDMAANPVEREEDIEKRMHQVAIDAQYEANVSMQELIEKYKRLRKETDSTYNELKAYQAKVKTVEKDKEKEIKDQKQRIHKLENTISTTVTDLKTQHQQKIIDVTKLAEETVNKNRALAEQLRGWGITPGKQFYHVCMKLS
ncbi:hypothetical protein BKA69DRAFT_865923 [Paraphysoderma sedebokerense]|nr:hypothetical protein BKA69DRAFT_865923 [Paraphysoderma sedebokerense]